MTLSSEQAAAEIAPVWQNSQTEQAFWDGIASLVGGRSYEKGDLITLLNAVRTSCSNVIAGPYALPAVPGGLASGAPVAMFASWACWLLQQMPAPASVVSGLQALGCAGLRRDAATDIARLAAAWYWRVPIFASPIPVVPSDSPTLSLAGNALNIAGAGAVNLPKIGPYLGASLQLVATLVQALFPGPRPPSPASVATGLFDQDAINTAARGLIADGNWLCSLYNILNGAGYVPVSLTAAWQQQNIIVPITRKVNGETPTKANLVTLVSLVDAPGVIDLLVYCASVYLALCKQLVTTDVSLAQVNQTNSDTDGSLLQIGSAIEDFGRFQQAVLGDTSITLATTAQTQSSTANWASQINALLLQVAAGRFSEMSYSFVADLGIATGEIDDKGTPQGTTPKTFKETFPPPSGPVPPTLAGFLQDVWTPYVLSVADQLDTQYADHFACIAGWLNDVQSWQMQLPVLPPSWMPTLGADPWTASVPLGAVWQAGTVVQYAVIATNETSESLLGPWSEAIEVAQGACPTLQLKPDQSGLYTYYQIARRVQPPGAATFGGSVVLGFVRASASTFTDTNTFDLGGVPSPAARPAPAPLAANVAAHA